jgi:hypothetical protein
MSIKGDEVHIGISKSHAELWKLNKKGIHILFAPKLHMTTSLNDYN